MAYAAYLRIYEPVSAFHEPDRSRWVAYAASSTRPRRRDSLAIEHAAALRRAVTTPWGAVTERESEHAYVRRVDGTTYVCPWQTRLRCLLAYGQMRSGSGAVLAARGQLVKGWPLRGRPVRSWRVRGWRVRGWRVRGWPLTATRRWLPWPGSGKP